VADVLAIAFMVHCSDHGRYSAKEYSVPDDCDDSQPTAWREVRRGWPRPLSTHSRSSCWATAVRRWPAGMPRPGAASAIGSVARILYQAV